ncbi:flagellar biosynthesis regulatory protein FlaF [Loktanella sp. IMCC34160]|uniref:flagellar biosynthesis regulator FlaF n=1 Tax=Loktanella sp. IMCC34160 TaxID=2510646 RepID=UPI00101CDE79|nr:flagellar biosynthesis regulator FlaF [Loktanella sp. IMCC34160]RYG91479.1 flagellar biosynthesis regulatory protein FlaF [Loktanella sp. IMCC34160]
MNVIEQARQAYSPAQTHLRTDRSTEAQLFAQINARLRSAASDLPRTHSALVGALHDNRQFWTLLAVDVADKGNTLPPELRAQIFYLAEFTFAHTSRVLQGQATPDALIEINRAMIAGLNGEGTAS